VRFAAYVVVALLFLVPGVARGVERADTSSVAGLPKPGIAGAHWSAAEIERLRGEIDGLLRGSAALAGAHVGLYAIDARTGTTLYARNVDDDFTPASNVKLITGSAALARLGRDFRFRTTLFATASPREGVIEGDLILHGGGDALLRASDLEAAAAVLADRGVHTVHGAIRTDASYFDAKRYGDGWVIDDLPYAYAAPVSALSLDDNVVAGAGAGADDVPVADPPAHAADVLRRALEDHGITTEQASSPGTPPPGAIMLWQHDSEPLERVLADFWYPSDNLIGEELLKALGVAQAGSPGSSESGIAAETAFLRSVGVDSATVSIVDGSGLSRYDECTPRALVAVLQYDWNSPHRDVVLDALPVAGVRGSLKKRFVGTPAQGRVFAKTGGMLNVTNLSGYIATKHHGTTTFSFLIDHALGEDEPIRTLREKVLSLFIE
jgi:D-alanyl-D-alanine carboxypeptidase/D-alanyl-D-alanine-endopeptidase (penicillin-binding protein 4)